MYLSLNFPSLKSNEFKKYTAGNFFAMNGIKNTSANAFRKKTISNVCSVSEDSRIKTPIVAKNVMAIVI